MPEITGTVTYWERIALPPSAEVRVALSGLDLEEVIAEVVQPTAGVQVPFAFALEYPEEPIDEDLAYVVRAEIRYDGRSAFVTSDPVRVLTQGNPTGDVTIRVHIAG